MRRFGGRRLIVVGWLVAGMAIAFPLGAIASHQFGDVPTSNSFHNDIDAIADAGVTLGCGGGNYCPDAFVTREQMAAFMNRLGALGPGKTPVVNADRVDGVDAQGLTRLDGSSEADTVAVVDYPGATNYVSVVFTAPRAGFVLVTAPVTLQSFACSGSCQGYGHLRHVESDLISLPQIASLPENGYAGLTITHVFEVDAGSNTFHAQLSREPGAGTISGYWGQMTVQFSPFGEASTTNVTPDVAKAGAATGE